MTKFGELRFGEMGFGKMRFSKVRFGEMRFGEMRGNRTRCRCSKNTQLCCIKCAKRLHNLCLAQYHEKKLTAVDVGSLVLKTVSEKAVEIDAVLFCKVLLLCVLHVHTYFHRFVSHVHAKLFIVPKMGTFAVNTPTFPFWEQFTVQQQYTVLSNHDYFQLWLINNNNIFHNKFNL